METAFEHVGLILMIVYILYGLIKSNYNENI